MSERCRNVGSTIRAGRFRSNYDAVVLAVARHGERVEGRIGDISLRSGDTLLLEARPSFVTQHYDSRDFLLVSEVARSAPPSHERAWVSLSILAAMVAAGLMVPAPLHHRGAGTPKHRLVSADDDRSRCRHRQGDAGERRCRGHRAELDESGRRRSMGCAHRRIRLDRPVHGVSHQHRRRRVDVPLGPAGGRRHPGQSISVHGRDHDGGVDEFRHADRLSDQPDGLRPGGVPLRRLSAHRLAPQRRNRHQCHRSHPDGVAVLSGSGGESGQSRCFSME